MLVGQYDTLESRITSGTGVGNKEELLKTLQLL